VQIIAILTLHYNYYNNYYNYIHYITKTIIYFFTYLLFIIIT